MAFFRRFCSSLALAACLALAMPSGTLAQGAAAAQTVATGPIDPFTAMRIPVAPNEQMLPLKNGCNLIVRVGGYDAAGVGRMKWFGACRFGLAHGRGYLASDADKSPSVLSAVSMHWGHMFSVNPAFTIDQYDVVQLETNSFSETLFLKEPIPVMKSGSRGLFSRNGEFETSNLVMLSRWDDKGRTYEALEVKKEACPIFIPDSMEKSLAKETLPPFSAAQVRLLVPLCNAALARLKAEGRVSGRVTGWPLTPYADVDYGYYVVLYRSVPPGYEDVTLCTTPASAEGCEAALKAVLAPYEARRDAMRVEGPVVAAAASAELQRRFEPLEAARRQKIQAVALRYAAERRAESLTKAAVAAAAPPPDPAPAAARRPAAAQPTAAKRKSK